MLNVAGTLPTPLPVSPSGERLAPGSPCRKFSLPFHFPRLDPCTAHIPVVVLPQDSPRAQALRSTPLHAKVKCGGKEVTLGTFATAEEAALSIARSPEGQLAAERAAGCSGGAGSSCTAADEPEQEQQLEARRAMLAGRKRVAQKRVREALSPPPPPPAAAMR